MARSPLITHVDDRLAVEVKTAAERVGVTASAYIGRILENHMGGESTHSIAIYARDGASVVSAQDLQEDDVITIDPVVGMERVMRHKLVDTEKGRVVWLQLERFLPRTGERISRFAFRGWAEPILVLKV
jgi:hypothetical protein